MPYDLRSTALAVSTCQYGIRCYTKTALGDVREACNDTSDTALSVALAASAKGLLEQTAGWYPGELHFKTAPDSTLCSILWGTWELAVFYQDLDGNIRSMRHSRGWFDAGVIHASCMQGTSIAEVHSKDGQSVMIFYQHRDGYVYARRAQHFGTTLAGAWDPPVAIAKASKCTGIAATTWNNGNDIRVYFQDESNVMREWGATFNAYNLWGLGDFVLTYDRTICSTTAVSWIASGRVEIRVYIQEPSDYIIEWCYTTGNPWTRGGFNQKALANSDVEAFCRVLDGPFVNKTSGFIINVFWAGPDQLLHQQVVSNTTGWLEPSIIAYLQDAGNYVGSWNDTQFNDNYANVDEKRVARIRVRSGTLVDGFAIDYTDGTSTPWHGGQGGVPQQFDLQSDEDITQILVWSDGQYILRLQFITSRGRRSIEFGYTGTSPQLWELDGRALGGSVGSAGGYINGLMPFWSTRRAPTTNKELEEMSQRAGVIGTQARESRQHCDELAREAAAIRRSLEGDLAEPANFALQGIDVLVGSVVELQSASSADPASDETIALIRRCVGESEVVASRFDDLHHKAQDLLERCTKLSTDLTYEAGQAEIRVSELNDMQTVADVIHIHVEIRRETLADRETSMKESVTRAEKTLSEAKSKRESAKTGRILRDIFTFGLGELGDWGGLEAQIDYANKLVDSTRRDLESSQNAVREAQAALEQVKRELESFDTLKGVIDADRTLAQETQTEAVDMLRKNQTLTDQSLDVSRYLGQLASKSGTLPTHYSARDFARSLIAIAELLSTPGAIPVVLRNNPDSLQSTLQMIASSREEPLMNDAM